MTIMNRGLLIYIENLCRKNDIPYQLSCFTDGGTDAGNIHKSGTGIPATTLSIPMRYMHTHLGVVHKDDIIAGVDKAINNAQEEIINPYLKENSALLYYKTTIKILGKVANAKYKRFYDL